MRKIKTWTRLDEVKEELSYVNMYLEMELTCNTMMLSRVNELIAQKVKLEIEKSKLS